MWQVCNKVAFCACFKMVFGRPSFSMFLLKLYETTPSTDITNEWVDGDPLQFQIIIIIIIVVW